MCFPKPGTQVIGIGRSLSKNEAVPNLLVSVSGLRFDNAVAAIIVVDDGRYLMQLRDDKPGIFYPGHWGLFGGAVEPGEEPVEALKRELIEELEFSPKNIRYFTRMDFDFDPFGAGHCYRMFFEVPIGSGDLTRLRLGEGCCMEPIPIERLLLDEHLVPYDSFALWLHYQARKNGIETLKIPKKREEQ